KVPRGRARSLPRSVRDERGEGWGEGFVHEVSTQVGRPSPWPSPHSFVVGRGNSFRQRWWYRPDAPPRTRCSVRASSFVIPSDFVIRHLSFFFLLTVVFTAAALASSSTNSEDKPTVIVVVGAPGEEEDGKQFEHWAGLWEKASP